MDLGPSEPDPSLINTTMLHILSYSFIIFIHYTCSYHIGLYSKIIYFYSDNKNRAVSYTIKRASIIHPELGLIKQM